jgi:predicted N-acyltransferase
MADYTWDLYASIDAADIDAWEEIRHSGDPFSDPRFLRAVELSMAAHCRLWHMIVRDGTGDPVACATLSLFRVDLTVVASTLAKRIVGRVRKAVPSFLRLKILFCGIPVSTGQCSLLMTATAEPKKVLSLVDRAMLDLAAQEHALLLCHKEFSDVHRRCIDELAATGYLCANTPPMHYFPQHHDFSSYLASLNAHYRYDIRRSMRKAERAGVEIVRLEDPNAIRRRYNPELHHLYVAVVERSEHQLELLPLDFFHELVRQFPGQVGLTIATIAEKVVAFNWSLSTPSSYHLLFCGIDYRVNTQVDLYLNLMYAELAYTLKTGISKVQMGQTADTFKARLGCEPESRYICVKSRYRPITRLIKAFSSVLFPPVPAAQHYQIYKEAPR